MSDEDAPRGCFFCGEKVMGQYEEYLNDVGEFWSTRLNRAVVAHLGCVPDDIYDPNSEWSLA